jgi:hypothetical protein
MTESFNKPGNCLSSSLVLMALILLFPLSMCGKQGFSSDRNEATIKETHVTAYCDAGSIDTQQLQRKEKKEGFKSLFNGKNFDGWVGNTIDYQVENGEIVLHIDKGPSHGNLYTSDEFSDFIFRFEFQLTPGANNGLGIRAPLKGDAAYVGMELQILDNEAPVYAKLQPYQYHGSVYGIIPAKRGFLKPTGEWNYQEVVAKGSRITVTLNGTVILDGDIKEAVKIGTPDHKEHPGLFNEKGHIGFLGHGSVVKFRNIRIKELSK